MFGSIKEVLRKRSEKVAGVQKMRKIQMLAEEEAKEPGTYFEELDMLDFRDDLMYK